MRFVTDAVVGLPGHPEAQVYCAFLYDAHHEVVLFYADILDFEGFLVFEVEGRGDGYAMPVVHILL